jgi:septal ring-binding cell division protein DamX
MEAEDWRETQIQTFLYAWGQLPEAVRSEAADTLPFRRVTDRIRAQALEAKALAGLQQFSLQSGSLKRLHLLAEALHLGEESALLSQLDADSQAGNQGRAAPEAAEADRPMDRGGDRARDRGGDRGGDRRPRDAGAKGAPPPPAPAVGLLTSPAAASLATRNRTTDPETAPPGLAPAFADESGPAPAGQAASSRPELTPAGQGPKKGTKAKLKDQAKDTMAGAKATGDAAAPPPPLAPAPLHASPAKPGAKGTGGIGSGGAGVPGDTPRASPRSTADDSDTHLTAPSAKTRPKDKAGKEKAGKTPDPRLEKEPKGLIDHGDRWLAGQDGKKFTVQLVSLQRLDKILHLLIAHPEVDAKIVRNPGHAGGGGYRILMGAYASLDEAKRAIAQLPEPLRRAFGTPLVRPVASLRPTTTAAARRPAE